MLFVWSSDQPARRPASGSIDSRAVTPAGPTSEFFHLIYNEQHQPSQDWFGEHGWDAAATGLAEYLRALGRPVPPESEGGDMVARTTLVVATKG